MTDQVEVFPQKNGKWHYRDGDAESDAYETRREAIAAAREAAGQVRTEIFDAQGKSFGEIKVPGRRVVLLREDGSIYGELDPPPSNGSQPQFVSITPVSENDSAKGL